LRDLASEGNLKTIKLSADTEEGTQTSTAQEILEVVFDILRTSALASKADPPAARRVKIYLKDGSVDVRVVPTNTRRTVVK
jgi:hypothetical protein